MSSRLSFGAFIVGILLVMASGNADELRSQRSRSELIAMFNKARQTASVCSPVFMKALQQVDCIDKVQWHGEAQVPMAWSLGVEYQDFMDHSDIGERYFIQAVMIDRDLVKVFDGHIDRFCTFFELDCTTFTERFMVYKSKFPETLKSVP